MPTVEVRSYQTSDGRQPFTEWLAALSDGTARARILARIDRLRLGLRGDWKAVGSGVFELRVDSGPGYRVYCGQYGTTLVLLLCAGSKRTQQRDIEQAHENWKDYKARR
jgi:putative addiction module killer protein